ncbi:NepR family anti-sigma factor [Methylobacterium haplocladii]|uniref:NepR family anti-sigma factor n=1 Tax=Methylobacterium haplocladii TaxID=1176176 RepID=UPI0011BF5BC3|nr:NepR family anti-sigma factor [Methylobacterium haplocladii]
MSSRKTIAADVAVATPRGSIRMMHDETAESLRPGGAPPHGHDQQPAQNLGKQARKRIGSHLRSMYDSVVQQPIPSRFTDLIAQLDDRAAEPADDEGLPVSTRSS